MALGKIANAAVAVSVAGIIILAGMYVSSKKVHADEQDSVQNLAQIGLNIAPVYLNLTGKDPTLVGLGSYIVNAQADCNGCHTSSPVGAEFGVSNNSNNPYLLFPNHSPWKVQAKYYLGGGQNFGPAGPGIGDPTGPYYAGPGNGPLIITRNLTPDYTGLPEGGHSLSQFLNIMHTGHDYDQLHLNCGTTNNNGKVVSTNCYYTPNEPAGAPSGGEINGAVLQVMPWAVFSNMTDYQLTAIWTYLSAIPCIANTGSPYSNLINVCH
jgi:hypothetical protein